MSKNKNNEVIRFSPSFQAFAFAAAGKIPSNNLDHHSIDEPISKSEAVRINEGFQLATAGDHDDRPSDNTFSAAQNLGVRIY